LINHKLDYTQALDKAVATLAAGDFYEAQQLFKSVAHRLRSRKQAADSYAVLQVNPLGFYSIYRITCFGELCVKGRGWLLGRSPTHLHCPNEGFKLYVRHMSWHAQMTWIKATVHSKCTGCY
jgi:hypothetical protein